MTRLATLSVALILAAPAVAQQQPDSTAIINAPAALGAKAKPASEVAQQVAACAGEKFVFAWGAGASPTKVTLCSDKGADSEAIVRMLEDGAAKIERTTGIPEDRRLVLVQQIRAKVAEVKARDAKQKAAAAPSVAPGLGTAPRPVSMPASASAALLLPKPRLTFSCFTPGDIGSGGPCVAVNRDTRVTVRADEAIPAATGLRFTRRGEQRAELAIGPMRKGQSRRLVMPSEVCRGVSETEIEILVTRGTHPVDTRGPYLMRC